MHHFLLNKSPELRMSILGCKPDTLEVVERRMLDNIEIMDICKHPQHNKLAKQQSCFSSKTYSRSCVTEKGTRPYNAAIGPYNKAGRLSGRWRRRTCLLSLLLFLK
ncbi:uncharacterized [Tachysurus ichikawai]